MPIHIDILNYNKQSLPKRSEESRKWFDTKVKSISNVESTKNIGNNIILFKHFGNEKQSYQDVFPIIYPVDINKDSIIGFNLHYIPPIHRAYLMDNLIKDLNKPFNANNKFIKSLNAVQNFSSSMKKYSIKNIRSKIIQINPDEWKQTLFLPIQYRQS